MFLIASFWHGGIRDTVPDTALPATLATISTDTGALAPGHRDFAHYDAPGLCLAAAKVTYDLARRNLEDQLSMDTTRDARHDTVGIAAARAIRQQCFSRAGVVDTFSQDNVLRFRVALLLRDDDLALKALERLEAQEKAAKVRTNMQLAALVYLLGTDYEIEPGLSRPPLLKAAQTVAQKLLRDGSLETKFTVYTRYLDYWDRADSLPQLQAVADTLLSLYHYLPDSVRHQPWPWRQAYTALMRVAFFTHSDSMAAIAARAQRDSIFWRDDLNIATVSRDSAIDLLSPIGKDWNVKHRTKGRTIHAVHWYPFAMPGGSSNTGSPVASRAVSDTVLPAPGTISLLIAGGGPRIAAVTRKWRASYTAQQLAITVYDIADDTAAWWTVNVVGQYEVMMSGPLTVAERGEKARWYYQDYEHLPVDVALGLRHTRFRPFPLDQRRDITGTLITSEGVASGSISLTDRTGKVIWSGMVNALPIWFDRLLTWAVTQDIQTPH